MGGFWLRWSRGQRLALVVSLAAAALALGPWLFLLVLELALLPLLGMCLPYLKILPALYSFRLQQLLARHYATLTATEETLRQADDPATVRRCLHDLDALNQALRELTRKLPASMQAQVYHLRLHIELVERAARQRLRSLESHKHQTVLRPQRGPRAHRHAHSLPSRRSLP